jgi:glycosyltransferase involved in cell wall biosynthesis
MKVLFVSGMGGDTRRYRCTHHQEQLALAGVHSTLREPDDLGLYLDVTRHDIVVLHRAPYSDNVRAVIEIAHALGKPVIFETDDLVWRTDLLPYMALLDTVSAKEAQRIRRDAAALQRTLQSCDCAIVSTHFLAKIAESDCTPAFVHRNACSREMILISESAHDLHIRSRSDGQGVTIGYFSGTGSHNRDFATVAPALLAILSVYPDVRLLLGGYLDISPAFDAYSQRIQRAPFVSWRELPQLQAQVDINIAPLEPTNPFCQAKSEIKYSEAALVGLPTVATPVDAFQFAIRHGENGMLATGDQDWQIALRILIEDPSLRHAMGDAAREHVLQEYGPQVRSEQLIALLEHIQEHVVRPDTNPGSGPEVVAEFMTARLEHLAAMVDQRETEPDRLRNPRTPSRAFLRAAYLPTAWQRARQLYAQSQERILSRRKSRT